ncbi:MAG: hypothetical protein J7539_11745 [Niabella sp.]|nr:hypothetical protein [Niabella sp.]
MARLLTLCCFLFFSLALAAQPAYHHMSDYLSIKKKNGRTVQNYYPGMPINFVTTDDIPYEGPIAQIKNDSVFVRFFQIVKQPTIWGNYIVDTVKTYTVPFHYKDIKNIIANRTIKRRGYLNTLGFMLKIGGAGYAVISTVNSLRAHEAPFAGGNGTNLLIATGAFGLGYYMNQRFKSINRISKKNRIVYVNMQ